MWNAQKPVTLSLTMIRPSALRTSTPHAPLSTSPVLGALAGVVVAHRVGIGRVHHVEDLHTVFVSGNEHVRPADFMIVREGPPVGRPGADRPADILDGPIQPRLEVENLQGSVLILGFDYRIA